MTGVGEETAIEVIDSSSAENAELQMSEGPVAKKVALGHATTLAGLTLQLVLQYAGSNEGIFVANVCKSWKKSYISTFKEKFRAHEDYECDDVNVFYTHRAVCMMNLQRIHWVWSEWCTNRRTNKSRDRRSASLYLGSYAPRLVVQAALLDDTLAIDSVWLLRGIAGSGREILLEEQWKAYKLMKASATPEELANILNASAVQAAKSDRLRVLALVWSYLEESPGESATSQCGEVSLEIAVQKGYIRILEFLRLTTWWSSPNGPKHYCHYAAIYNQTEVLTWLRAHGFEWEVRTSLAAGANAEISTLDFLLENGCSGFDKKFVSLCVQSDRVDALQWCYDTLRPRMPHIWTADNLQACLLLAGTLEKQCAAEFLLEHGAEWPDIGGAFGRDIDCHDDDDYNYDEYHTTCIWSPTFIEWAMARGCTFGTWSAATCARLTKETEWNEPPQDRQLIEASSWAHSNGCTCGCPPDVPAF